MLQILFVGLLCVGLNAVFTSSAPSDLEYNATISGIHDAQQLTQQAPSVVALAPDVNWFPGLTKAEIQTLGQAFPDGTPQNDGGVAQQISTPNCDWTKVSPCNESVGFTADPDNPKCWYWCLKTVFFQPIGRGCRYCCWLDLCWNPPVAFFPLGYCTSCRRPPSPPSSRYVSYLLENVYS